MKMEKNWKIIKTCYKNVDSSRATYRALRGDYSLHNCPTTQAVGKIMKKFEETEVVTSSFRSFRVAKSKVAVV